MDLLAALADVAASSGSACASSRPDASHVLRAMGLEEERALSSVRFSLGRFTTLKEVERAVELVTDAVREFGASFVGMEQP